ncbi:MAG: hypothetical protein M0R73_13505 [Dehalococcoidia bacterium]|nr:hypothetical protein [Dehalococcoidia bacterium]
MTQQRDLPPETPDNFRRTPHRDPTARSEEVGDLPAEARPNRVLLLVMGAAVAIALAAGVLMFGLD